MIKIKKRRNPNYIETLKDLIGKSVTVRINYPSDLGYFSIEGILKFESSIYRVTLIDKQIIGRVSFTPNMVIDYKNNTININVKPYKTEYYLYKNDKEWVNRGINGAKESINDSIRIIVPSDLFYPCSIDGKLKYNNSEKFYYIGSSTTRIQCRFIERAIMGGNQNEIYILLNENLMK